MRRTSLTSAVGLLAGGLAACSHATDVPASSSADFPEPVLPAVSYRYADADVPLPPHFFREGNDGSVVANDNTPPSNPITNAGATLGRVLFYDVRLSKNDRVSCASCHVQAFGFGDTARFGRGFNGSLTRRHAMALANVRFYKRNLFFRDERAASLEAAALMPIQDTIEMGMALPVLETKLAATPFYAPLFNAAFGSPRVASDRVGRALAQFLRSIVSYQSKFDQSFGAAGGAPNSTGTLTAEEILGHKLFTDQSALGHCSGCHRTDAQVAFFPRNNGLDVTPVDTGAGAGRFKAPSLRNIAVRGPYMHDGRFATLDQVVDHYNAGIQGFPYDRSLEGPAGGPQRLNLTTEQHNAIVAFLRTLTDSTLLTAAKFSNPYPPQ